MIMPNDEEKMLRSVPGSMPMWARGVWNLGLHRRLTNSPPDWAMGAIRTLADPAHSHRKTTRPGVSKLHGEDHNHDGVPAAYP